jgi:hypothetical protein
VEVSCIDTKIRAEAKLPVSFKYLIETCASLCVLTSEEWLACLPLPWLPCVLRPRRIPGLTRLCPAIVPLKYSEAKVRKNPECRKGNSLKRNYRRVASRWSINIRIIIEEEMSVNNKKTFVLKKETWSNSSKLYVFSALPELKLIIKLTI